VRNEVIVKDRDPNQRKPDFTPCTVRVLNGNIVQWATAITDAMFNEIERKGKLANNRNR
jgi:hypothetical protein